MANSGEGSPSQISYSIKQQEKRLGIRRSSVSKTIAKCKASSDKLNAVNGAGTRVPRVPGKGSTRGCMTSKGGPDNVHYSYRGVRQRTWGKWVAEIREPNQGKKLCLGTYETPQEAASAYDEAASAIHGTCARLNLPPYNSSDQSSPTGSMYTTRQDWKSVFDGPNIREFDWEGLSILDTSIPFLTNETLVKEVLVDDPIEVLGESASIKEGNGDGEEEQKMSDREEIMDILVSSVDNVDSIVLESAWWSEFCHKEENIKTTVHSKNPPEFSRQLENNAYATPLDGISEFDFLKPGRPEDLNYTFDEIRMLDFDSDMGG